MDIFIEIFGYIGMALVLTSMLMTKLEWLRWFNLAGSVVSMIYGICTATWPTAFLNLSLGIINIVQLIRIYRNRKKQKNGTC